MFCKVCIEKRLETDKNCPICKDDYEFWEEGTQKIEEKVLKLPSVEKKKVCKFCDSSKQFEDYKEYGYHLLVDCKNMVCSCKSCGDKEKRGKVNLKHVCDKETKAQFQKTEQMRAQ